MSEQLKGYDLSRAIFNFCFDNPGVIKPNDIALYFFIIEHCNRLGWKKEFGLPTSLGTESLGMSRNIYLKSFNKLVEHDFIQVIQYSSNQYNSNIIAISKFNTARYTARGTALDTALIRHDVNQEDGIVAGTDTIDKPQTNNHITTNQETKNRVFPKNGILNSKNILIAEKCQNWLIDTFDFQVTENTLTDIATLNEMIAKSGNTEISEKSVGAFKFFVNNLSDWIKENKFIPSYWIKDYPSIYNSLKISKSKPNGKKQELGPIARKHLANIGR